MKLRPKKINETPKIQIGTNHVPGEHIHRIFTHWRKYIQLKKQTKKDHVHPTEKKDKEILGCHQQIKI